MFYVDRSNIPIAIGNIEKCKYLSHFSIVYNSRFLCLCLNPYIGKTICDDGETYNFPDVSCVQEIHSCTNSSVAIECYEWLCRVGFHVTYTCDTKLEIKECQNNALRI